MRNSKRALLLVAALLTTVTALVGSGAGSATAAPIEMKFACALKSNGLMRYVSNLNQCKSTEEKVTINPGPTRLCIQPDGSVRKVASFSSCKPPARQLTLPPLSGTVYFCAANSTGVLRDNITDPSQCTSSEFAVFVMPFDQAPSVTTTSPTNGATHVGTSSNITVNFSESVTVSTSSFSLECPTGTAKSFSLNTTTGSSITLDPTADLPAGTTCAVKVIANNVSDTDTFDPPDHMAADYNFSFTTDSAPTVATTSPVNGATGVNPSNNITVTFSEPVSASASSFTIECPAPGNSQSFGVSGSGGSTITLDPNSDLPAATTCTVTVIANQISDVDSGDPPDGLASNYIFSFTTADAAPTVTTTSPGNTAVQVATSTDIIVNFSEPVTATTSSFTLECPSGTPKSFGVSGSGTSSVTLNPNNDLPEGTICSVKVVGNQISDVDSVDPPDTMAADYNFSFTTDSAPAVTTTTPADSATNVDPTANITVNFNEPVNVTTSSFSMSCDSNPQSFSVSGNGTSSVTINPNSDLPGAANCTVTAIASNISDVDTGDPPDNPAANTSFSFTTQDTAPSVTSTTPANGATEVARDTTIAINFSESVSATNNAFSVACPTGTPVSFTQSSSPDTTITLTPSASLPVGTVCTVTVHKDEISDTDSVDPPDTMAADYTFSFTTKANQAPTDIALSNSSVDENQPSGTTVGTLSTTDPDPGDTATYSFATGTGDTDNGSFQIVGSTLETNAVFDFEAKSSYSIRVKTTDSGSLSFEKQFTISVNDVNEAPTDISLDNNSIDENQPSGTTIGSLTATDPDIGQTHSFAFSNSCSGGPFDNGSFSITGNTLKSGVSFNYEVKNSYTICVRTTDSGSPTLSFDKSFTVTINDVNDAPVATADSYSGAIGNTLAVVQTTGSGPQVALTGNVLTANDTDEDTTFPHTVSAVAETVSSTGGGTAIINTDGSFTFLPGVGDKNQNDTFTYHATDGSLSSAGTVTVHIDNFLVWYVNNALGSNGDGRSSSPFNTIAGTVNGAGGSGDSDGPGDYIFLYQGSGNYTGGLPLEQDQQLIGQPHGLTVNGHSLVTAGGSNPTVTNASGNGVALANGVDVERIDVTSTGSNAAAVFGGLVGNVTIGSNLTLSTSGSGGAGIQLNNPSGTVNVGATIQNTISAQVLVNGDTGTVAFAGPIGGTGQGIELSSNTGGTINFTGGIQLTSTPSVLTTAAAFDASGGGTVNVTGSANTISTSSAHHTAALKVANTTIGASGLTFRSISFDGANAAPNGIVLVSTGSTAGLTVSGTGSAGSGGTIQSIAGADLATNNCGSAGAAAGVGVYLNNTKSPSLSWMNFTGTFGNFGILGYSVDGFTLDHASMTGTFGDNVNVDDDTVHFCGLTGSATISNSTISNGAESNLRVVNASGTLNRITLQSDTFGLNQTNGGGGTLIEADGGTTNVTVLDSTFQGSRGTPFNALAQTGATMDLVFGQPSHGNTIHNTHSNIVPFAQDLAVTPTGTETFDINSNHFDSASAVQAQGGVIINAALGTAVATGYFRNNTIGTSGVANSGSSGNDPALDVESNGGGDLTIKVDNNQMYQWGSNGAGFLLQAGATSGNPTTVQATVTNNTIAQPGTFAVANTAQGFQLNNGTTSGENFTSCLLFSGNTVDQAGTGAGGDVRLRQRFDTKVQLPGYTGAADGTSGSPTIVSYIQGLNPTGPPTVTSVSSTANGGGFFNTAGGANCALPGF